MAPSLYTNYVVPAVLLNPVLLLHSVNAILSRILPPITVDAATQPPPYSLLGPSAEHPHIDMHANDNLCWSYTMVMVCAQLVAFGRVNRRREEMRESSMKQKEVPVVICNQSSKDVLLSERGRRDHETNGSQSTKTHASATHGRDGREGTLSTGVNGYVFSTEDDIELDTVR